MILDRIISHKRAEVEQLKRTTDTRAMIRAVSKLPPGRSLAGALKKPGRVALLAEIKSASPSRGVIRKDFSPGEAARIYTENGADAISVLTDQKFFGGAPEHLEAARRASTLPILRKDFIIDPAQVYQSRLLGADAVLLICSALAPEELEALLGAVGEAGMEALVEVHSGPELEVARGAGASIIGINNRDLKTFRTSLETTFRLCESLRGGPAVIVSESGIKSAGDMRALKEAGVDAALVGEALMAAGDMAAKVRELRFGQ